MIKKAKKNVPELRFPEFEEDWQLQKLKNILIESNHLASEELPLYSLTIESGIVPKTERYERSFLVKNEEEAYKVVQPNDFAYNPMNLRFGALARHTESRPVKVSKYYNIFSVESKANIAFVDYLLTKSSSIRFYDSIAMGSLVEKKRVHFSDFIKCKFLLPSIAEQEKIASFLGAVDTRLNQLRRKRERLQTYKRGIMQKLFSQQIRFTQPDGSPFPAWEELTLGEIAEIKRGASPRPISNPKWFSTQSNIGWVRISDVTKSDKYLEATEQYLSDDGIEKSRFVPSENLIMSICATIGKPIITKIDVCIHDGFVIFENLEANILFIYFLLRNIEIGWKRYGQPGIQLNLNTDIVSNESIFLPCKEEQEKIADFLTTIDRKIAALSRQIEQTEQFKKGLLQKLFV